jgi:hypothetical protein
MRQRIGKRDEAEDPIYAALTAAGVMVYRHLPSDLLLYRESWGPNHFKILEVKSGTRLDKRQENQRKFMLYTGVPVVRTIDEALKEAELL